jgi:hypothetical protein
MNADSEAGPIGTRPKSAFSVFTILLVAFTIDATLVTPVLAVLLAGAGHGWIAAVQVSWIALVTGPIAIVAWVFRRKWWIQLVTVTLLAGMLAADYVLFERTKEDFDYFANVWYRGAHVVIAWSAAWLYLHAVLIASLGWGMVRGLLWLRARLRPLPCESDEAYKPVK